MVVPIFEFLSITLVGFISLSVLEFVKSAKEQIAKHHGSHLQKSCSKTIDNLNVDYIFWSMDMPVPTECFVSQFSVRAVNY